MASTLDVLARQLSIAGPRAYLTGGTSTVSVLDVTNPSAPAVLGSLDVTDADQIAAEGDFAYVGRSGTGLSLIDASDPSSPTEVTDLGIASVTAAHVGGGLLYLMVRDSGVQIFDLDDPSDPETLGSVELEHAESDPRSRAIVSTCRGQVSIQKTSLWASSISSTSAIPRPERCETAATTAA